VQRGASADRGLPGSELFFWDMLDHSRTLAKVYNPEQPPPNINPVAPRMNQGRFVHIGTALEFVYDRLQPYRPLGKPDGTLDKGGQDFIARQIALALEKMDNTREYMLSQALTVGTFAIQREGDQWIVMPTASASGEYMTVDLKVPAGYKNQLGGLIAATWATAGTDIPGHLWNIRAHSQKVYGEPVTEAWINSTTFQYLRANNLMAMGSLSTGSFIIYKSMTKEPANNDYMQHGAFDVVFNAMPHITFHVLDRAYNVTTDVETTVPATMTIPDNVCVFTPRPSRRWLGLAEGSRTIQPKPSDSPRLEYGFHSYEIPRFGPGSAGKAIYMADSFLTYFLSQYAVYIATVAGY
jgi:hypothetical protein